MFNELEYSLRLIKLCKREGFEIYEKDDGVIRVIAEEHDVALKHPSAIWLSLYRKAQNPEAKFKAMRRAHDLLWPDRALTYNSWTDRRFRVHCENYEEIVLAGGAATGKSEDTAKIAIIFWQSDPLNNTAIITSTTLQAVSKRIWGYVARLTGKAQQTLKDQGFPPIPGLITRGVAPKIIHPQSQDLLHGMFAAAVPEGADDSVISNIIGTHPAHGLMMVLDESTDMNPIIAKAFPNLKKGVHFFQVWAIGNSKSKNDLHGALATPKNGWESVKPERDFIWETNRDKGVCLYFYPFDSPAITEKDPVRRAAIRAAGFLPTEESLEKEVETHNVQSDSYYRFVLGFWKKENTENVILSEPFVNENQIYRSTEFAGIKPLTMVAGLDAAIQTGGTNCILRLAVMGQNVTGGIVLDYRENALLFRITVSVIASLSSEQQIVNQVLKILREYNCSLRNLAIDTTGIGRILPGFLKLAAQSSEIPLGITSVRPKTKGDVTAEKDPNIVSYSPSELWFGFKDLVVNNQIRGIDPLTGKQMIHRLVHTKNGKLVLESKEEYKNRMSIIDPLLATSPDEADAAILCAHAAMLRAGLKPGMIEDLPRIDGTRDFMNQFVMYKNMQVEKERADREAAEALRSNRPKLVPSFSSSLEGIAAVPRSHGRRG